MRKKFSMSEYLRRNLPVWSAGWVLGIICYLALLAVYGRDIKDYKVFVLGLISLAHFTGVFSFVFFRGTRPALACLSCRIGSNKPPISATFLLYLLLCKEDREILPGDLEEEFTIVILPKFGPFRAWLWYWVQALIAISYRNTVCRWLLVGGGVLKFGEWVARQLRG